MKYFFILTECISNKAENYEPFFNGLHDTKKIVKTHSFVANKHNVQVRKSCTAKILFFLSYARII